MERPHYRRVSGSGSPKGAKQSNPGRQSTFSERLAAQFIICGVIMALILILNLINTSLTHNIKSVIQDQPSADDVMQVFTDATDSVKTILGNTTDGKPAEGLDSASDTITNNAQNSDSPEPAAQTQTDQTPADESQRAMAPSSQAPVDFRIDEDILTQIQADSDGQ